MLMRPYARTIDVEPFRAELNTNGFRTQVSAAGARYFVQQLKHAGPGVVTWVRSERPICGCGEPLTAWELDACETCLQARRRRAVAAEHQAVA